MKKLREPQRSHAQNVGVTRAKGGSTQLEPVRLSFEHFTSECVSGCSQDKLCDWTEKLKRLTSNTWQQVTSAPRQGLGHEKIPRAQATFPIPVSVTPDVEFFLAFRCGRGARMVGFRDEATLQVLWVAERHDAY